MAINNLFEGFNKYIGKHEGICGKTEMVMNEYIMPIKQQRYNVIHNNDGDGNMLEMESNKIVHINKLLGAKKYGVGKMVNEFVDGFKEDLCKKDCNVKNKMAE